MTRPNLALDLNRFRAHSQQAATAQRKPPTVALVSRDQRTKEVERRMSEVPALPTVVMDILQLSRNPRRQSKDYEGLIRQDQGLTCRVLKLVNSSFYGLRNPVTSITRAVVILGEQSLKSLVLAASTRSHMSGSMALYGFAEDGLWAHAFACATIARGLGKIAGVGRDECESFFVAGLLHDIGLIATAPSIEQHADEVAAAIADGQTTPSELEDRLLGVNHAEIGARMVERWQLDPILAEVCRAHDGAGDPNAGPHARFVQLADALSMERGLGLVADYQWPLVPSAPRRQALGLRDRDAIVALVDKTEEMLPEMMQQIAGE